MEAVLGILIGVSLAAACGFRVFVPLFVLSIVSRTGHFELTSGWEWLGEWPAMLALGTATCCEISAYYIPWLDNLLDTIAAPVAVMAGSVIAATCMTDLPPMVQWSLAIVAGGGTAGGVQGGTMLLRGTSTATTGGLGNFLVATLELLISLVISVLAILAPILAALALTGGAFFLYRRIRRRSAQNCGPQQG